MHGILSALVNEIGPPKPSAPFHPGFPFGTGNAQNMVTAYFLGARPLGGPQPFPVLKPYFPRFLRIFAFYRNWHGF